MILALLPPKLLRHLQFVVARQRPVIVAASWSHLLEAVATKPISVIVIDPSWEGDGTVAELRRLFIAYPSIPVLAYVPLTPPAFHAVAELANAGLEQVILYSHEDSSEQLRSAIEMVRASPLTGRLLAALNPKLSQLPISLAKSIEEMFEEPHRYLSAHDLAVMAKVPISRLYRAFLSVELASPKRVLVAAKLLRGYTYLRDPGNSVQGVSLKLGYRKARIFADQAHEVFGLNPSRLTAYVSEDGAVTRLLEWCELSPQT